MIFRKSFDKRVDPAEPAKHGRFIDTEIGGLLGEAAHQNTKQTLELALKRPSDRLPTAYPAAPDGPTYYDQPLLQTPVWIWTVPLYFYLGGTAGGALTLGAAAQAAGGNLKGLISRCHWIGTAGLSLGTACLIYDLGRPTRFLNMLRVFRPTSPLSVGSWLLASATPLAGAAAVLAGVPGPLRHYGRLAGYIAGGMGMPLAGYTGVVLAESAVPAWQEARRTIPVMFVGSAIAGTASILEMMHLTEREERAARLFGIAGKSVELAGMFAIEREASRLEHVGRPFKTGKTGWLWRAAKLLSLASLALSVLPGKSKRRHQVAGALGTLGAVANRYAMLEIGKRSATDPRATFELQRHGRGAAAVAGAPALIPPAASAGGEQFHPPRTLTGHPE